MSVKIYFSNRAEILVQKLQKQLLIGKPFLKRIVIVENIAMKNFVMQKIAENSSFGVAFGLKILTLNSAFNELIVGEKRGLPSKLELGLRLEMEIYELLTDFEKMDIKNQMIVEPLYNYLVDKNFNSKIRLEKRVVALADKLASLFHLYSQFGKKMLNNWQKSDIGGWQKILWQRIICENEESETIAKGCQIHLFAPIFFPQSQHERLLKIGSENSLFIYHLSPCKMFWSDILSDREELKREWEIDSFLLDKNPLLANFGKIGRVMSAKFEESIYDFSEYYQMPKRAFTHNRYIDCFAQDIEAVPSKEPLTLVDALQADLLLMPSARKMNLKHDRSLQIHNVCSKQREIEVLYDNIMSIIDRDKIDLKDIVVLSPNIAEFEPYIKSVFGGCASQLNYNIQDQNIVSDSEIIQAFLHIIDLPFGKWDAQSILELFNFTPFKNRADLDDSNIEKFYKWIKKAGIKWGENGPDKAKHFHRKLGIKPNSQSAQGTWKKGFNRLLLGLCMFPPEENIDNMAMKILPATNLDMTDAPLLGKFMQLVHALMRKLSILNNGSTLSLTDWVEYLKNLLEDFFRVSDSKDSENYAWLVHLIDCLSLKDIERKFSFTTIKYHLQNAIFRKKSTLREKNLNTITFANIESCCRIPFKVVSLIGMTEEAFPRKEKKISINLLQKNRHAEWSPTKKEFDRYFFLQALLSARKSLIISYQGYSKRDNCQMAPSMAVQELISYLDNNFEIDGIEPSTKIIFNHPFKAYDKSYFDLKSPFLSYSQKNYLAARSYYNALEKENHIFIKNFEPASKRKEDFEDLIRLQDLSLMAKNPLQAYFNKTLNIYFDKEDSLLSSDDPMMLSYLDKYILQKNALSSSFESAKIDAEKKELLPVGPFKDYSITEAKIEFDEIISKLDLGEIIKLEFSEDFEKIEFIDNNYFLPPLKFDYRGKCIKIIGKIDAASQEGLCLFVKDEADKIIKYWPTCLVFLCLIKKFDLPLKEQIIYVKSGKIRESDIKDPIEKLRSYLDYYFDSLENISPLIPEWIPSLMEENGSKFEKKAYDTVTDKNQRFFNDYLKWIIPGQKSLDAQDIFKNWQNVAKKQFGDLL